jgi:hypothetical protein
VATPRDKSPSGDTSRPHLKCPHLATCPHMCPTYREREASGTYGEREASGTLRDEHRDEHRDKHRDKHIYEHIYESAPTEARP